MSFLAETDRIFSLAIDNARLLSPGIQAHPISFKTEECLSHSQKFLLEFESPHPDVDLDSLLGEEVKIWVRYRSGVLPFSALHEEMAPAEYYRRHYYAYVTAGYDVRQHGEKYVYQLEMSTWLWFLGQNRNSRIFQEKNILTVIEETFSRYKQIADYVLEIEEDYPEREYCVQFGETDLDFINRLLEEEGVWYYFRHQEDKHVMVITDRQAFSDMPDGYELLSYQPSGSQGHVFEEGIQEIQRSRKVRPNEVILRDYDYLRPSYDLQVDQEATGAGLPNVQLEWYDYAAGYHNTERGEKLARLRLQMMQSERQMLTGQSNAIGLVPGYAFTLYGHPGAARNRRFKVLAAHYTYTQGEGDSANDESASGNVSCSFTALNDDVPNRPLMRTPRPEVSGLQSATVVGAPGSEVYTDQHARIRVHFHWDRYKSTEEDSSCWVRVVQAWAGKGWGVIAMPRVGQEVLITYVDGDLDRPMVTGIVYNGENPPPYDLPRQIGHTGIRSRSLKHGLPQNNSEITLVDDRGREQIIVHAERDMNQSVEQDLSILVERDCTEEVKRIYDCTYNIHIYYTNLRYSITGLAVQLTNIKKEMTGLHVGMTSVDFLFTGMKTSFTGLATSVTTVGTHFTGMQTNFTGLRTSMTAIDSEVIATKNKVAMMENDLLANKNSFVALNNEFVGSDNIAIVKRNCLIGANNRITGVNTELYGINTIRTGNFLNLSGAEVSIVGVRNENYEIHNGNICTRIENVGKVIRNSGCEVINTGLMLIN
ncbi:type VI secretion system Vgr family protein [Serratia sp. AKBS12]|uniref:type VI secretion system Vgr family protein n=1 Tax=Serratia sp. AKBS12 TaxID=2974597 RepID=UPI002165F04E|nr:type VI secretion system tip protein TssI/VgrG [Serratia sp. AKBS12]MCS3408366.1 type VI secretion system tip protein VgrG [Serratia sp. AKBS12]HEI8864704.1 type VI secretion system tip protein VgrG [Serratia odorifera]